MKMGRYPTLIITIKLMTLASCLVCLRLSYSSRLTLTSANTNPKPILTGLYFVRQFTRILKVCKFMLSFYSLIQWQLLLAIHVNFFGSSQTSMCISLLKMFLILFKGIFKLTIQHFVVVRTSINDGIPYIMSQLSASSCDLCTYMLLCCIGCLICRIVFLLHSQLA